MNGRVVNQHQCTLILFWGKITAAAIAARSSGNLRLVSLSVFQMNRKIKSHAVSLHVSCWAVLLLVACSARVCQGAEVPRILHARQTHTIPATNGWVTGMAFSPDNKILASAGYEPPLVTLWDVTT